MGRADAAEHDDACRFASRGKLAHATGASLCGLKYDASPMRSSSVAAVLCLAVALPACASSQHDEHAAVADAATDSQTTGGGADAAPGHDAAPAPDGGATAMDSGGGGGVDSSTGGGDGAVGCAQMPLCDDFESDTANAAPSSSLWTIVNAKGCGGSAAYTVTIDNTVANSGSQSLKVSGGDSCGPLAVNTSAFGKITGDDVYGRFYVRIPMETPFDHATLMTLGLDANPNPSGMSLDQANNLQLASETDGTAQMLMWQTTDSDVLPQKNAMGGAASTDPGNDMWTCIRFHTSKSTGALETWVGTSSTSVTGLTYVPGTTAKIPSVNDQWTPPSPFAPTALGLGWIVFSGPMITLWFDDVAIDNNPVGCL